MHIVGNQPNLQKYTGGVLQYDFGKTIEKGEFIRTGSLCKPPTVLSTALLKLQARHRIKGNAISRYIKKFESNEMMCDEFRYQGSEHDQLFEANYDHEPSKDECKACDEQRLQKRKPRNKETPEVHYGLIGSADQVMRHGATREVLRKETGILCFEMEAAGLMDNFPCLIIRGICDYSDTHKNKRWQPYAAATAAAYAKELLEIIPKTQVTSTKEAAKIVDLS